MPVALPPASFRFDSTVFANGGVVMVFHGAGVVAPPVKFRYTDWTFGSVTAIEKLVDALESYWSVTVIVTLEYTPTVPGVGAMLIEPVPLPLSVKVAKGGRFEAVSVNCAVGSSFVVTP